MFQNLMGACCLTIEESSFLTNHLVTLASALIGAIIGGLFTLWAVQKNLELNRNEEIRKDNETTAKYAKLFIRELMINKQMCSVKIESINELRERKYRVKDSGESKFFSNPHTVRFAYDELKENLLFEYSIDVWTTIHRIYDELDRLDRKIDHLDQIYRIPEEKIVTEREDIVNGSIAGYNKLIEDIDALLNELGK